MAAIVIVGGGMVGLTLARLLRDRGHDPVVLERSPAGRHQAPPFMLGFQGFEALADLGLLERVRREGWDIAPGADGVPVAICVEVGILLGALGEGVPVRHEQTVTGLVRDGDRVVGVTTEGPDGRRRDRRRPGGRVRRSAARRCARWPGSRRRCRRWRTPPSPS